MEGRSTLDGGAPGSVGLPLSPVEEQNGGFQEKLSSCGAVKEETRETKSCSHGDDVRTSLNIVCVKEEGPEEDEILYCEECRSFFYNKCELHGPPVFIPDSPVPIGVVQRDRRSLPAGLELGESALPHAALGVFNRGHTLPLGAHFGAYQGDVVEKEEAMESSYSWVIFRSGRGEDYIDAKRETHANWMRFVNCARNHEEQNLVAFQYRGGIFYRCCRAIRAGQELLVWYSEDYAKDLSSVFQRLWNLKCSSRVMSDALLQVFSCSLCPLSFTSQVYLHEHLRWSHEENVRLLNVGEVQCQSLRPTSSSSREQTPPDGLLKHPRSKNYPCTDCGRRFVVRGHLQQHQRIHTGERPYHCSLCDRSFNRESNLQQHQRIHTGDKPHWCSQCGKSFSRMASLQIHQHIHTGEKPYCCTQCGRSFSCTGTLLMHQRIHTGEKPFQCSHCEKRFSRMASLQTHQHIHTGQKPYQCSQCGKLFTQKSHLQKHQRIHTGEDLCQCSQCGKRFSCPSSLQIHQRVHTGEKPHQCSQCGKSFSERGSLQKHQRIHTGEKPHQCSECGKRFSRMGSLHVHERIHTGEKPYRCSQCDKCFSNRNNLKVHQRIHTGEKPYPCSLCELSFSHKSHLTIHQRVHTGEKPYPCSECGRSFTQQCHLQKHQRTHTGEKPYHCSDCGRNFPYSGTLRSHKCSSTAHHH